MTRWQGWGERRMITIVLAEDHKIVREGIRLLLDAEDELQVIGEAGNGTDAVQLVRSLRPDILITDLVMEGMNGIQVTNLSREHSPGTRVIVLSMYSSDTYVSAALEHGATGYVVKGSGVDELVRAIHEAMSGRRYLSPPLTEQGVMDYRQRGRDAAPDP